MFPIRYRITLLALAGAPACSAGDAGTTSSATSIMSVPLLTYSTKSDEARRHVEAGERFEDIGYPLKANEEFKRAVAADSSFGYAYLRVAQNAYSGDEYAANVRRAGAHTATASPVEKLLIESEQKNDVNDYAASVELLKQATTLAPQSARVWYMLGREYQLMTKGAEARAAYEKAVAADTTYARALFAIANSYVFNAPKDYAKAEAYVLRGQKLWPNTPAAFQSIGALRRAQNRLDDAIAAYTEQIKLDPTDENANDSRGNANAFAGHYDAARADFDAAFRVAKPQERAGVGLDRAFVSAYQGNFDAALKELEDFRAALSGLHTASPEQDRWVTYMAQVSIATLHWNLPLADSAVKAANTMGRALAKASHSEGFVRWYEGQANFMEGTVAAYKGDFATARARLADAEKARAPDVGDPSKDQQTHGLRGLIALLQKDYSLAATELATADPTDTRMDISYWRALAAEGTGNTALEKELLQKVATYNFSGWEYAAVRFDAIQKLRAM